MPELLEFEPPSARKPGVDARAIWWDEFHSGMWKLAQKLGQMYPSVQDALVITRGGQGVSAIITAVLEKVRNIETVAPVSYEPTHQQKGLRVVKGISAQWLWDVRKPNRKVFIFEDIIDTGVTARFIQKEMARLHVIDYVLIAAVVKPAGKPFVDHYAFEVEQSTWVEFPWDWRPVAEPASVHVNGVPLHL